MKCPSCERQHKAGKSRQLLCTCGYRFVFDPRRHRGLSDGKFLAMLRQVSNNNTVYFTLNQLYVQYCRRVARQHRLPLGIGLALVVIAPVLAMAGAQGGLVLLSSVLALLFLGIGIYNRSAALPSMATLQEKVNLWRRAGKPLDKLLTEPGLQTPPPQWQESDIYDYGVERLLIVEPDLLVDLLVRNGFHAEERTLVLSESGYPSYLVPVARRCLAEQPDLPVYLLHDATRRGTGMEERLSASGLLPLDGHALYDLGLFPRDVKLIKPLQVLKPHRQAYALPVDMLPVAMLTMGLTQALAGNLVFGELLRQSQTTGASVGGDGDFG